MKYVFGVDVGGTSVKIGLFADSGALIEKFEIPSRTEDGGKDILPDIAASVSECCEKRGISANDVIGIGIGVPGPVDDDGNVNCCVNLNWGVFNLHESLGKLTGVRVKAGNDANLAALGEYYFGGGKGSKSMLMVTLGTGIGGGFVDRGRLLNGEHGVAGEIGHITINRSETNPCTCGKYGCAEQYASARGMARLALKHLEASEAPSMLRAYGDALTSKELFACSAAGDETASEILEEIYEILGEMLADGCCMLDPELIVLGGGASKAGLPLLEGTERHFVANMFHACRGTRFALATLGNDAGIYGAFGLIAGNGAT